MVLRVAGALFTMYLSRRPSCLMCSLGALASREVRGVNRRLGVRPRVPWVDERVEFVYSDARLCCLLVWCCVWRSASCACVGSELVPP